MIKIKTFKLKIVLADAHFPTSSTAKSSTCGTLEIRADGGASLTELLAAIVKFIPLDQYDEKNVGFYKFSFFNSLDYSMIIGYSNGFS